MFTVSDINHANILIVVNLEVRYYRQLTMSTVFKPCCKILVTSCLTAGVLTPTALSHSVIQSLCQDQKISIGSFKKGSLRQLLRCRNNPTPKHNFLVLDCYI